MRRALPLRRDGDETVIAADADAAAAGAGLAPPNPRSKEPGAPLDAPPPHLHAAVDATRDAGAAFDVAMRLLRAKLHRHNARQDAALAAAEADTRRRMPPRLRVAPGLKMAFGRAPGQVLCMLEQRGTLELRLPPSLDAALRHVAAAEGAFALDELPASCAIERALLVDELLSLDVLLPG